MLFGTAGIYFQAQLLVLGALQALIYAGGITVLVFSILLTSSQGGKAEDLKGYKVFTWGWAPRAGQPGHLPLDNAPPTSCPRISSTANCVRTIGHALMSSGKYGYILPFEVISLLLLACIVGSILIALNAKKHDYDTHGILPDCLPR